MRIILFFIFAAFVLPILGQTSLYKEKIRINYKSTSLTAENIKQIRGAWEHLPLNTALELLLVSKREVKKLSPDKLVALSKARADAIKLLLTTQKIVNANDIELNTRSFIENEAIYGTSATYKHVIKDPYKVYSLVLSKEVPMCFNYTDAERWALSSKDGQFFTISSDQDAMIKGKGGVIVQIPSNSFILPEGKRVAEVTIKLWEFLTIDEIISANLYTTSAGRLLETGGMIYISAEYQGTCLKLLRSSKIIIKFPTYERLDSMRTFKGVPLPQIVDWKKTDNEDKGVSVVNSDGGPPYGDGEGDFGSMNYYVLESSGLGWINCDRFSEVEEKADVAFTCLGNFKGTAGLIFTEINSVMPGDFMLLKKDNIVFSNVPIGREAVVLVYAISKDNKTVSYASKKVILGKPLTEELKMKEVSLAEFKETLKYIKN